MFSLRSRQVKIAFRDKWQLAVHPVKRLSLAIIALCFCLPITQASAQLTETIHSSCRFWLSIPDRVRRASNLTMTVFTISNEKSMKNVGWSLGEPEIVRTALDLCRQNLEDPLIDVVGPFHRRLETEGR
jgi:hypothetical protein